MLSAKGRTASSWRRCACTQQCGCPRCPAAVSGHYGVSTSWRLDDLSPVHSGAAVCDGLLALAKAAKFAILGFRPRTSVVIGDLAPVHRGAAVHVGDIPLGGLAVGDPVVRRLHARHHLALQVRDGLLQDGRPCASRVGVRAGASEP